MAELKDHLQQSLGGAYALGRELGGGGMSRVFTAEDTSLGREVVIKVLPPDLAGGVNLERFRREIQMAARLQHACIVPVLSAGAAGDVPYYTMPLIEGESLRHRITKGGELPLAEATRILRDMAEALSYAHEQGVVHRDIKPDNVLLSKHHALVADFGVSKALSASTTSEGLTSVGIALGTPAYMAPEQAAGEPTIDHRADIYAFGATAYEVLTGSPPFANRTGQAQLMAHAVETPVPIAKRRPTIPPALASLVDRCLAKRPADRPQSADEILETLAAVTTPTSTTPAPARVSGNRRRFVIGAVVAGAAAFAAGGFAMLRAKTPALNPTRVVFAELDNETGDSTLNAVGRMVAEGLGRGLDGTSVITVASSNLGIGEEPGATKAELKGIARAREIARQTRAGTVVWGAYYRQGDSLRYQVQISDANTGDLIRSFEAVTSPASAPDRVIAPLRERVGGALAALLDFALGSTTNRRGALPTLETYKEISEGSSLFLRSNYPESEKHYRRAIALDSNIITPYAALSSIMWNSGAFARLDSLDRAVEPLRARTNLSAADRDILEWIKVSAAHDLRGKMNVAERIVKRDSVDVYLYLAGLYHIYLNEPREARELLRRSLENDHPSGFFGFWTNRVAASLMLEDYATALTDAEHSQRLYPTRLEAVRLRLMALAGLRNLEEVRRLVDSVRVLGAGGANVGLLSDVPILMRARGDSAEAKHVAQVIVDWQRGRPPAERKRATSRANLAYALYNAGEFREAKAIYDSLARELPSNVSYLASTGIVAAELGDRAGAMRVDSVLAAMNRPYLFGTNTQLRAHIAGTLGDGERAVMLLKQAMAEHYSYTNLVRIARSFERIRNYGPYQDFLKPKG